MKKEWNDIEIFYEPGIDRGKTIARALTRGARSIGLKFSTKEAGEFSGKFSSETVAFYGVHKHLREVYDDVLHSSSNLLFFDLGYFGLGARINGSLGNCFHRVGLNDRHPNKYFRNRTHSDARFVRLNLNPGFIKKREKRGDYILVAGMGEKVADFLGMPAGSWESAAIEELRDYTDRPIIYRPKLKNARTRPPPIQGTTYSNYPPIQTDLARSWCAVVHQSNVAIDALLADVPVIVTGGGAASAICHDDISNVDDITRLDEDFRRQFFYDLAYTQWTVNEMADGTFLRHAMGEGLIV